ncbi:MAG: hypothetical protein NTU98_11480 [Bacteroidetes bacterium]|nr:hypothetical protein [Bacteroidota bacterium]
MKGFQETQGLLFNKIKTTLPSNLSLVDVMSDLLQVSSDSAYRRIRGETPLTLDEIILICNHFKVSFDALTSLQAGTVNFSYNKVEKEADFIRYLTEIRDEMTRISRASEKSITYTAVDIPIFHYFRFPEYFYFKMFYWLRSVAYDPDYLTKKYRVSDVLPEVVDLCKQLSDLYAIVPSTEVWSDSILNSIIKQIIYYWNAGLFESKDDALKLIDGVRKTLEHVQREAEMNMKLLVSGETNNFDKNFQLYYSDIEIGNNFIIVSIGHLKVVYSSFHTFNKMFTTNRDFCDLTEYWTNTLIKQANLISGVAEKLRFQFFKRMYCQLDAAVQTIEKDL